MKNIVKAVIVSFVIALPTMCFAQKALKFGHINQSEVIQLMPDMDSVKVKSQVFVKGLLDELEVMQVEFNNKLNKFNGEKDKLIEFTKKSREDELNQMNQRIQDYQQNASNLIQENNQKLLQPILEKVQKALTDVGKENGFIYIFDLNAQNKSIVYYSSDSQDVTDMVKQKLGLTKAAAAAPKK